MGVSDPKGISLIRILQILQKYSDYDHPLTQADILDYLDKDYGIMTERRSISRKIKLLCDADYDIASTKSGSYLASREFEDSELRMLIDAVLSSKYISSSYSKDLIDKLCAMSNKYFRSHVKNIYSVNDWSKTANLSLFYNIEVVDDAIERRLQIRYDYNKYGIDKKLHKSWSFRVTPYQLILHNQRYYLMAKNEHFGGMVYHRLDHITNMIIVEDKPATPITDVPGFKGGIDYKTIANTMPYMYSDEPKRIELIANKKIVDQIIEWFGTDIDITELSDKEILVNLRSSLDAMEYWAMQYIKYVEIKSPNELRERIKENIKAASLKYI